MSMSNDEQMIQTCHNTLPLHTLAYSIEVQLYYKNRYVNYICIDNIKLSVKTASKIDRQ